LLHCDLDRLLDWDLDCLLYWDLDCLLHRDYNGLEMVCGVAGAAQAPNIIEIAAMVEIAR
jgi:hypothetical protein